MIEHLLTFNIIVGKFSLFIDLMSPLLLIYSIGTSGVQEFLIFDSNELVAVPSDGISSKTIEQLSLVGV